jgi:hypothetical protein
MTDAALPIESRDQPPRELFNDVVARREAAWELRVTAPRR